MESAKAKYDHVVQCLQQLKQIYRNAEMSETMLSPHTVSFTRSGLYVSSYAIYKSCLKWQSFFRVIWWRPLKRLFKQLPVVTDNVQTQFSHWIYWFSPNWGMLVILLRILLRFFLLVEGLQIRCNRQAKVSARKKRPRYKDAHRSSTTMQEPSSSSVSVIQSVVPQVWTKPASVKMLEVTKLNSHHSVFGKAKRIPRHRCDPGFHSQLFNKDSTPPLTLKYET